MIHVNNVIKKRQALMKDLRLLTCRLGQCWMWTTSGFGEHSLCPHHFLPHQQQIPRSSILKKSKHPDGQRDGLSLTEGLDLLSSQMFEIPPPACIIERNVLITLT